MSDRIKPAYFTVEDLRGGHNRYAFHVRAYDKNGRLLVHSWHRSHDSMMLDTMSWEARGAIKRPVAYEEGS